MYKTKENEYIIARLVGDDKKSIMTVKHLIEEIIDFFSYWKDEDGNDIDLLVSFEKGSVLVIITIAVPILSGALSYGGYSTTKAVHDFYKSKKIQKAILNEKATIKRINDDENGSKIKLIVGKEELIIPEEVYENLTNKKNSVNKKKLVKSLLKNKEEIQYYGNEGEILQYNNELLSEMSMRPDTSELLSENPITEHQVVKNGIIKFDKFDYNAKSKEKKFKNGTYNECIIKKVDWNGLLDDKDLYNEYEPSPYVNGPTFECDFEAEFVKQGKDSWYSLIKINKIHSYKRRESSNKQLRIFD